MFIEEEGVDGGKSWLYNGSGVSSCQLPGCWIGIGIGLGWDWDRKATLAPHRQVLLAALAKLSVVVRLQLGPVS